MWQAFPTGLPKPLDGKKILRPPCFTGLLSLRQLRFSVASRCLLLPAKGLGVPLPHGSARRVSPSLALLLPFSPYTQPALQNSPANIVMGQPQAFLQSRFYISGRLPIPPAPVGWRRN